MLFGCRKCKIIVDKKLWFWVFLTFRNEMRTIGNKKLDFKINTML